MVTKTIRSAALGMALGLAGLAMADGTLKGVTVDKSGPGVSVLIKGKDLAQPMKVWANKGSSLILEFDAKLDFKPSFHNVNEDGLVSVNVQRQTAGGKDSKVRVHLRLSGQTQPRITETADGWLVFLNADTRLALGNSKYATTDSGLPTLEPASTVLARLRGETAPKSDPPAKADKSSSVKVSLDFVNTEVVQILKALAMQSGVNIVTAPEVKGTLTVAMDNVSVKEALDMVTTVAGLRYAKVANAYVVATADRFDAAVANLTGKRSAMLETRVVPIYSGSGAEIRASVLSSMTDASAFGQFQIFLPNENYKLERKKATSPAGETSSTDVSIEKDASKAGGVSESGDSAENAQVSVNGIKEQYLVLVGPSASISDVEDRIRDLDRSISKAYGYESSANTTLIRRTYHLKSDDVKANELVKSVGSQVPSTFLNVDLYATPASFHNQSVVIVGREAEVARAEKLLSDLDASGYGDEVVLYEVKHSDPRALREALVGQVKGLRVSIAPGSAANPRLYTEGKGIKQASESTKAGEAEGGAAGNANDVKTKDIDDEDYGLSAPYSDYEKVSVPMRLTLTGTREQLDSAARYLGEVDVAVKQVALELRVLEISKEEALKIGLDWSILTGGAVSAISLNQSVPFAPNSVDVNITGRDWGGDVRLTLDQFANKSNLIARPNLLAVDGREAEIFVGDVVRYIESIEASQNGTTVKTGKVPVGVRLSVMPRIGDGNITMDLRPSVSFLRGFTDVPGGGKLPQTSLRTAQSTVVINSGETIAIGGLIQDQDVKSLSKVPILGDLPLIGRLFQRTDNSRVRREVVFFLTAQTVDRSNWSRAADPRTHNNLEIKRP